ncbi:MAG: hypothetical protein L6V85_05460 [Clostridiales bacterium]|nr:MAG: hypothetical protein L6V85_05460 [Clostridiales bacterium]
MTLDGFGELKAQNLINAIEKSKDVALSDFLYALGVKNIGKKAAKQLEQRFKTLNNVINAGIDDLKAIDDFGDIMAEGVRAYFDDKKNLNEIDALFKPWRERICARNERRKFQGYQRRAYRKFTKV